MKTEKKGVKMLGFSSKQVEKHFKNKYEAIIVIAKEARRANQYESKEITEEEGKPINRAILKALDNKIKFIYESEEVEDESKTKSKVKEKK